MSAILFLSYLGVLAAGYWLSRLNVAHLRKHGREVPPEFEGVVDPAALAAMTSYTVETSRLGIGESVIRNSLLLLFLFSGMISGYDRWIASLSDSFLWNGAAFYLLLLLAGLVIDIPFGLYRNFVLEQRFGFNTMTPRVWTTDLLKSLAVSAVLGCILVLSALAMVQASPERWWLWVWAFFLFFGIFLMYVSPYVIEPLFFTFKPLAINGLEERIRALMERAGVIVGRVFQVDASRRSRHSNAYFTGIGRVKRIVLFDTLLGQMGREEILAVLAHEAGHWKKRHVLKRLALSQALALFGFLISYHLLSWDGMPTLIGQEQASFYVRVMILGLAGSVVLFPFTPLFSMLSRRDEREADRFASDLTGDPGAMASALVKLSKENLSNLHPHPLYAAFYYSHPPVVERVRGLRGDASDPSRSPLSR